MSLIYNTLEKIESDGGSPKTGSRVVSKKKISSSPVSLLLLAIILSAVIYFGYMVFDHYTKKKKTKTVQPQVKQTIPVTQNQYLEHVEDLEEAPVIPEYNISQKTFPENADTVNGTFTKATGTKETRQPSFTADSNAPLQNTTEISPSVFQHNSEYQEPDKSTTKTENDIKQLNRTAKIIKTVAEIRKALLATNDSDRMNSLLDKLKKLKGSDNGYVLKLEAVIHMKTGNYEKAETILKQITIKKHYDREIEVNLAIIELNTHRVKEARKRLQRLNQLFPEDDQILQFLKESTIRH